MKAKIDYQKILLEQGERIGLIAAGVIAGLLLLLSLLMPGHGLFAGSPAEKAKVIDEPSTWVDSRLKDPSNLPTDTDKPTVQSQQQLIAYKSDPVNSDAYQMHGIISSTLAGGGPSGRRVPRVFGVEEAVAEARRVNIRSFVFINTDPPKIVMLSKDGGAAGQPGATPPPGGRGPGMGGLGGIDPSRLSPRVRRMLGLPADPGADDGKKDNKWVAVELTDFEKHSDKTPAEQVRPTRLAVIAASFPYKKQVEEFRAQLGLKSNEDVLKEASLEKASPPSFRFLGVQVQRRELDGDGKVLTPFADVDVNEAYKPLVLVCGRRFEEEDPALGQVACPGLVMSKLQQFTADIKPSDDRGAMPPGRGPGVGPAAPPAARPAKDQYPPVEKRLKLLTQTLEAIKAKGTAAPRLPGIFRTDDLDSFAAAQPPPATPPSGTSGAPEPSAAVELPDYSLVRVIDVTVEGGKTYEYQIRVRMGNPNFNRTDVLSPTYAKEKDLFSDWVKVATPVTIEPDLFYYAVDQKDVFASDHLPPSKERYRGPYMTGDYAPGQPGLDRILFMQAHRWLSQVKLRGNDSPMIVGEWGAAERFPVRRGDYVGHSEKIDVPYWKYAREGYVIAKVEVDFGVRAARSSQPEALLVDFDPGRHGYSRDGRTVVDVQGVEALLLNPDGKLILLEGAKDAADGERAKRRELINERIIDVRSGKTPGSGNSRGPGFSG